MVDVKSSSPHLTRREIGSDFSGFDRKDDRSCWRVVTTSGDEVFAFSRSAFDARAGASVHFQVPPEELVLHQPGENQEVSIPSRSIILIAYRSGRSVVWHKFRVLRDMGSDAVIRESWTMKEVEEFDEEDQGQGQAQAQRPAYEDEFSSEDLAAVDKS